MKAVAYTYLIWSLILIGTGIYIVRQMTDLSNPSSFNSRMNELKKAIDNEDTEIP